MVQQLAYKKLKLKLLSLLLSHSVSVMHFIIKRKRLNLTAFNLVPRARFLVSTKNAEYGEGNQPISFLRKLLEVRNQGNWTSFDLVLTKTEAGSWDEFEQRISFPIPSLKMLTVCGRLLLHANYAR